MEKKQFEETQKLISRYVMFIADVKKSSILLRTRSGRREFQSLLNEAREILNETPGIIQFEDSGIKFKLIRKGDCIGFVVDTSVENVRLCKILDKWKNVLKRNGLRFHQNHCSLPSLNNYMEFFNYLEKDSKNANIKLEEDTTKNKTLNIAIELDVEDFIDEDYVKDEISYILNDYDWKVKSIELKDNDITKKQAHEARETLFKFATINEKFDLIEGRKLNKTLGIFIDNTKKEK